MLKRITLVLLAAAALAAGSTRAATLELLNVSYDPTRELWRNINAAFIPKYQAQTGTTLDIKQSHGGSGTGKLSFLAAWGSVTERGGSEADALAFVKKLYAQVPVLDLGARGSTTTFVQKRIGDVHLSWENEAHLEVKEASGELEIVYPPISFLAEPQVTWVDANVKRKGTEAAAKAYLEFLYTDEAQTIIAKNFYRPTNSAARQKYASEFPEIKLFRGTASATSWED